MVNYITNNTWFYNDQTVSKVAASSNGTYSSWRPQDKYDSFYTTTQSNGVSTSSFSRLRLYYNTSNITITTKYLNTNNGNWVGTSSFSINTSNMSTMIYDVITWSMYTRSDASVGDAFYLSRYQYTFNYHIGETSYPVNTTTTYTKTSRYYYSSVTLVTNTYIYSTSATRYYSTYITSWYGANKYNGQRDSRYSVTEIPVTNITSTETSSFTTLIFSNFRGYLYTSTIYNW